MMIFFGLEILHSGISELTSVLILFGWSKCLVSCD